MSDTAAPPAAAASSRRLPLRRARDDARPRHDGRRDDVRRHVLHHLRQPADPQLRRDRGPLEIGLPFDQVLAATCLVAGVMTIIMGLYTNKAYAIAPGLGLNAVVAFSLVAGEGLSFPAAMGLVVVEGIAVTILVLTGMRERIMDAIPLDLKKAIAIGIGLFIAFIGLVNSGLVIRGDGTIVDLAPLDDVADLRDAVRPRLDDRATGARRARRPADRDRRNDHSRDGHQRGLGNDAGFTGRRVLARRRLRDARPLAARRVQLRRVHRARVHLRDRLGFSLFLADFSTRWARSSGSASRPTTWTRTAAWRTSASPARRLARRGRGRRGLDLVGHDLHRVGVRRQRRRQNGLGRRRRGALFFPFMFIAPIIGMVPPQATAPALILVGFLMMSVLTEAEEDAEGPGRPQARRDRLHRRGDRARRGADDHVHAVHVLDHGRDRDGLPRLHVSARHRAAPARFIRSCGSPRSSSSSTSRCRSCKTHSTGSEPTRVEAQPGARSRPRSGRLQDLCDENSGRRCATVPPNKKRRGPVYLERYRGSQTRRM